MTSPYHGGKIFWKTIKGSLGNKDGNGNENGKKRNKVKTTTLCTCIMLFCTFFSHRCKTATWTFLISHARFTEWVNTTQKVSFPFSKLGYGPFGFNPENFTNIWQIKWNWIRSMKFETLQIYFLSEFWVCCHPKILLPWQCDITTSPPYSFVLF